MKTLFFVASIFMIPAFSQASACELKIADLQQMSEKRMEDSSSWEDVMDDLGPKLKRLGAKIQNSFFQSQTCSDSQLSELENIYSNLTDLSKEHYRSEGRIFEERETAFICLSDIGVRLSTAQDQAMNASNRLQVQRLGQISDTLSEIGSLYTDALFAAEAARLRNGRLIEMVVSLQSLCEGMDF